MEAQVVHYNQKYKNFKQCLKNHDGICVLVYFFLVTKNAHVKSNPFMDNIIESLKLIHKADTETQIAPSKTIRKIICSC